MFTYLVCGKIPSVCSNVIELAADKDPSKLNDKRFDVIFSHYPSSSSLKNLNYFN